MGNFIQNITSGIQLGLTQGMLSFGMPFSYNSFGIGNFMPMSMPYYSFNQFMPAIFSPIINFCGMQNYRYSYPCNNSSIFNNMFNYTFNSQIPNCCTTSYFMSQYPFNNLPIQNQYKNYIPSANSQITIPTAQALFQKWSNKKISKDAQLTPEFCEKVIAISKRIKCDADDLMAVMYHESRFNPAAKNEKNAGKNVGLIQFGATARSSLNVPGNSSIETYNTMLNMPAIDQLDYVEKYYINAKKQAGFSENDVISTGTLAALAFRPKYAKQEILAEEGCKAYEYNKNGLDKNNDGKITKTELANRLYEFKA